MLIVNKTDLAPYVGVDVAQMVADAEQARDGRAVIALSRNDPASVNRLSDWVLDTLAHFRSGALVPVDPGPMARHVHAAGDTACPRRRHGARALSLTKITVEGDRIGLRHGQLRAQRRG